jgi:hypothetical protein
MALNDENNPVYFLQNPFFRVIEENHKSAGNEHIEIVSPRPDDEEHYGNPAFK